MQKICIKTHSVAIQRNKFTVELLFNEARGPAPLRKKKDSLNRNFV